MPFSRADQIRSRQAVIRTDLDNLEALEDPSEEDGVRTDALLQEWDDLAVELEPLAQREQRIAAVRAAASQQANHEDPEPGPDLIVRNRRDPYADLESVRAGMTNPSEVRARAVTAIEQFTERSDHWGLGHDAAENATRMVQKMGAKFGTAVARQMLVTGSPEYLAAFESYLNDPGGFSTRAALSLTPANGGYLVPFTLDPTIILTNAGSANPYRQYANVKTTATNDWNGVTSAGVSAEWTAEGIEAADASPTVGPLKITPQKADAYLFGSFEILSDSDFGAQLPDLLADAKDRLEETSFAVGTGTGQPKGIIPAGTTQNRAGTAAAGPVAQDVYALQSALPARFRGPRSRNAWVGNLNVINSLRNVPSFTGSTSSIVNDDTDPPRMLGKPFLESTSIVGVYTTGSKVLAYLDFSQYFIVDRVGMSIVYDPVVLGANRRPTGQGAWYAFWRTGADVSTATAVRVFATLT
jgi:HK97 family phage major capsid protein